jgi:hypothetical protein
MQASGCHVLKQGVDECASALSTALTLPAAVRGNSCDSDRFQDVVWHDRITSVNAISRRLAASHPKVCDLHHILADCGFMRKQGVPCKLPIGRQRPRIPGGEGIDRNRGSTPCKANCPCISARDVERGQGAAAGASRPRCRTRQLRRFGFFADSDPEEIRRERHAALDALMGIKPGDELTVGQVAE